MSAHQRSPVVRRRGHGRDARATLFIVVEIFFFVIVVVVVFVVVVFVVFFFVLLFLFFVFIELVVILVELVEIFFLLLFFLVFILGFALGGLGEQFFGWPGGPMGEEFKRDERGYAKRRQRLTH